MWIRADEAFEAIVDPKLFYTALGIIQERNRQFNSEEMLGLLKQLYQRKGYLSGLIIDEAEHLPSSNLYKRRFGSLIRAYKLVGFTPDVDYTYPKFMISKIFMCIISYLQRSNASFRYYRFSNLR